MRNKTPLILFFFSAFALAQTTFFNSKLLLSQDHLTDFSSSITVDSTQVYFNANDSNIYAHDKKTGILNWSYDSGSKSNNPPISHHNNLFFVSGSGKWEQVNTKTGNLVRKLKIKDLSTKLFIKDTIMYCAAVVPITGGAILAYDLKHNEVVFQKYIGDGISRQPFFFKNKIVANFDEKFWFELDYTGNVLDKDTLCYSKNFDPIIDENYCSIHYDLLNQCNKDLAIKNIAIQNTKYYYANDMAVVLEENELKIINDKNIVSMKIDIRKILKLPGTKVNDYREILKVDESTISFFYENTLVVYDYKKDRILKTYNLSSWNAHQVVLDENILWLISKNNGELIGLKLNKEVDIISKKSDNKHGPSNG